MVDADGDSSSGISMSEAMHTTSSENEMLDVHGLQWDDGPMVAGQRATDRLADGFPQGLRMLTESNDAYYYPPHDHASTTMAMIHSAGTGVINNGTAKASFPPSTHWGEIGMPELVTLKDFQSRGLARMAPPSGAVMSTPSDDALLYSAAQSIPYDAGGNFGSIAIRHPMLCPPGYEKKQFTHKMAHEIAQRHSIPYQEFCYYSWVDESYHHCPIADCMSGQNTFRGDAIKMHLEYYHPNITAMEKVVCARKSHEASKCQPGYNVKGKSYEQHFREKHSDAHSLCPFCGRRYRRADYLCRHFEKCHNLP